uniref:Pheromone-binding protein Gp-9 n=1 Tax=Odontomachus monticola TaxID=613454 RepID=A0A348G653_ODOMO
MKLLALSVCLLATIITTHASTIAETALHGAVLSPEEIQKCYDDAHLTTDELITDDEIKHDTYNLNADRARKNGCFAACILQKRGLIVDSEIQKDKLYAKEAHANLRPDVRAAIYTAVDRCVKKVETNPDVCDKSVELLACLWKGFL